MSGVSLDGYRIRIVFSYGRAYVVFVFVFVFAFVFVGCLPARRICGEPGKTVLCTEEGPRMSHRLFLRNRFTASANITSFVYKRQGLRPRHHPVATRRFLKPS